MFKDRPDLQARAMKRQLEKIEAGLVECTCNALDDPSTRLRGHAPDCRFETAWDETVEEIRQEDFESELDSSVETIGTAGEEFGSLIDQAEKTNSRLMVEGYIESGSDQAEPANTPAPDRVIGPDEEFDRAIVAGRFDSFLEPGEKEAARARLDRGDYAHAFEVRSTYGGRQ